METLNVMIDINKKIYFEKGIDGLGEFDNIDGDDWKIPNNVDDQNYFRLIKDFVKQLRLNEIRVI